MREMISFELGKEIEKDAFVLSRAWNKEKTLSPYEESNRMESNGWKIVFLEKHQRLLDSRARRSP